LKFLKYDIPEALESSRLKGNNKKNILVVISSNSDEISTNKDHLLNKIMSAVSINLEEDTHLIGLQQMEEIQIHSFLNSEQYQKLLLFGIKPAQVSIHAQIPKYQIQKIKEFQILLSDSIDELSTNQTLKKSLWTALQTMFPK